MNRCVQIILCFFIYVPLYRICSDSQVGTSSLCHNKGVDDVNEKIYLDPDVEGLEEVPNLPRKILEALNRENEGPEPNKKETKVINQAEEGEKGKPIKIAASFPKDRKDELITLLKEFKKIFA